LPEERIADAHRIFSDAKQQKLTLNNTKGKSLAAQRKG